jgi:hypothetical protein
MLVILYGLQMSASSFLMQLLIETLEQGGHPQNWDGLPVNADGHVPNLASRNMAALLSESGPRWIAVKTNGGVSETAVKALGEGKAKLITVTRDAVDCVLAGYEAGRAARKAGHTHNAWHDKFTIDQVIEHFGQLRDARDGWLATPGLHIEFEDIRASPRGVVAKIAAHLGLKIDPDLVVAPWENGERNRHNFNIGQSGRGHQFLTNSQIRRCAELGLIDLPAPVLAH